MRSAAGPGLPGAKLKFSRGGDLCASRHLEAMLVLVYHTHLFPARSPVPAAPPTHLQSTHACRGGWLVSPASRFWRERGGSAPQANHGARAQRLWGRETVPRSSRVANDDISEAFTRGCTKLIPVPCLESNGTPGNRSRLLCALVCLESCFRTPYRGRTTVV